MSHTIHRRPAWIDWQIYANSLSQQTTGVASYNMPYTVVIQCKGMQTAVNNVSMSPVSAPS